MQGLTGLTGIAGYQVLIDEESQASPEERYGDTVDPRHAERGERAHPYSWESKATQAAVGHGPYGPQNQLLGDFEWFWEEAGTESQDPTFDRTPARRAGPFPKGILSGPIPGEEPNAVSAQRRQSMALHGINTGAGLKALIGYEALNDTWEPLIDQTNPGHTDLQPIGRQAMSAGYGWGTTDRTQSFARQNQYGFDSSHQWRRVATGSIPGNYMYLRPGGRPMRKTLAGPARPPIGVDSPFEGDDLGQAFSYDGAILQNVPTEYSPPPQPNLQPAMAYSNGDDSVVEWY